MLIVQRTNHYSFRVLSLIEKPVMLGIYCSKDVVFILTLVNIDLSGGYQGILDMKYNMTYRFIFVFIICSLSIVENYIEMIQISG